MGAFFWIWCKCCISAVRRIKVYMKIFFPKAAGNKAATVGFFYAVQVSEIWCLKAKSNKAATGPELLLVRLDYHHTNANIKYVTLANKFNINYTLDEHFLLLIIYINARRYCTVKLSFLQQLGFYCYSAKSTHEQPIFPPYVCYFGKNLQEHLDFKKGSCTCRCCCPGAYYLLLLLIFVFE